MSKLKIAKGNTNQIYMPVIAKSTLLLICKVDLLIPCIEYFMYRIFDENNSVHEIFHVQHISCIGYFMYVQDNSCVRIISYTRPVTSALLLQYLALLRNLTMALSHSKNYYYVYR